MREGVGKNVRKDFGLKWAHVFAVTRDIDFSLDPLDPKFVPAKPKQEIGEKKVFELEKSGNAIYTIKRDGHRHLIAITKKGIRIYTRSIIEVTDRYPHIVEQIKKMKFPDNTLLDCEIFVSVGGKENLGCMTTVTNSSAEKSIEFQKKNPVSVMIFDIIVLKNKVMSEVFYKVRLGMIWWFFTESNYLPDDILPIEISPLPFEESKNLVRENGLEGLVVYDANGTTQYRLDGKSNLSPRPNVCWKWKPLKEDDFIVSKKIFVDGENGRRFKEVVLTQIDAKTGEEFECGKLGTFDAKTRAYLDKAVFPLVMQVEFVSRYEKSQKIREPRFMRLRDDKKPEECIYNLE